MIPPGRDSAPSGAARRRRAASPARSADHGMAVMLARATSRSTPTSVPTPRRSATWSRCCSAPHPATRWMRDPTRGGVATICNELARDTGLAVVLDETALPVQPAVAGACDLLGIDPLYVANEGKVVAVVAPDEAEAALAAMRRIRSAPTRRGSARSWPNPRGSSCCAPRSVARGSSTCSWATLSRGSADGAGRTTPAASRHGHRPGRRLPPVRVPPRRRARARRLVLNDSAGVLIDVEGEPSASPNWRGCSSRTRRRSPGSPAVDRRATPSRPASGPVPHRRERRCAAPPTCP